MSVLATSQMYLDRSAVANQRRLLDVATSQATRREGVLISKPQFDARYLGELGLAMFLRSKMPLHSLMEDGEYTIQLQNVIGRIKTGKDNGMEGKNSVSGSTERTYNMFTTEEREITLGARARGKTDVMDCKYTTSVSRPNSVEALMNRLDNGGSTRLLSECSRHVVMDRMSRPDSFVFGCINMYMWLQKCILYYSVENCAVDACDAEMEIMQFSPDFIYDASESCSLVFDTDNLTDEEIMVLAIALEGHEQIAISNHDEQLDIFTSVVCSKYDYELCARKKPGGVITIPFNVMAPEVALSTICSLCEKIGCIKDFLSAPDYVRGISTFNQLSMSLDPDDRGDRSFVLDAPADHMYGTIFGVICNESINDRVEHTNLASSTVCLMTECLMGQAYMNNLHYIAESLGIFNRKLFGVNPAQDNLYLSMMVELGAFREGMDNRMVKSVFVQGGKTGLYGDVRFFRRLLEQYVRVYQRDMDLCPTFMWLQLNVIYGSVFDNNSSSMVGQSRVIDASSVGPMVSDPSAMDKTCEWMMMHGLTTNQVVAGGLSNVGGRPLYSLDPSIYQTSSTMNGLYGCQWSNFSVNPPPRPRGGYDSNQLDSLYYMISYFCIGENKNTNDDSYVPPHRRESPGFKQKRLDSKTSEKMKTRKEASQTIIKMKSKNVKQREGHSAALNQTLEEDLVGPLTQKKVRMSGGMPGLMSSLKNRDSIRRAINRDSLYSPEDVRRIQTEESLMAPSESQEVDVGKNKDFDPPDDEVVSASGGEGEGIERRNQYMGNNFNIIESPPDGDCMLHTVRRFHELNDNVDECDRLLSGMEFEPGGGWQSDGTAAAINQMLGYRTVVINEDGNNNRITVTKVQDAKGTCYIRYDTNHFDLYQPVGVTYKETIDEIQNSNTQFQNIVVDDLNPNVAQAYSAYLTANGLRVSPVVSEHDGSSAHISISPMARDPRSRPLRAIPLDDWQGGSEMHEDMLSDMFNHISGIPQWQGVIRNTGDVRHLISRGYVANIIERDRRGSIFSDEYVDLVRKVLAERH